jgi:hypothetical protein
VPAFNQLKSSHLRTSEDTKERRIYVFQAHGLFKGRGASSISQFRSIMQDFRIAPVSHVGWWRCLKRFLESNIGVKLQMTLQERLSVFQGKPGFGIGYLFNLLWGRNLITVLYVMQTLMVKLIAFNCAVNPHLPCGDWRESG